MKENRKKTDKYSRFRDCYSDWDFILLFVFLMTSQSGMEGWQILTRYLLFAVCLSLKWSMEGYIKQIETF